MKIVKLVLVGKSRGEVEVADFYLHRCWEQEDVAEMVDLYMEAEGLY